MLLNDGSTQCVPADSVSPEDIIFTVTMNSRASIVDVRDAHSFLSILRQDEVHEDYTVPFPITFVCVHCRGVESFFSLIGRDRDTGNGVDLRSARSFLRHVGIDHANICFFGSEGQRVIKHDRFRHTHGARTSIANDFTIKHSFWVPLGYGATQEGLPDISDIPSFTKLTKYIRHICICKMNPVRNQKGKNHMPSVYFAFIKLRFKTSRDTEGSIDNFKALKVERTSFRAEKEGLKVSLFLTAPNPRDIIEFLEDVDHIYCKEEKLPFLNTIKEVN